MTKGSLYHYRAMVRSIYDGDTMRVNIDLGLGVWLFNQQIRLYGIDTPEIRGPEKIRGTAVRDAVLQKLPVGTEFTLETIKDRTGKYGRWLGIIWPDDWEVSLNDWLIETGRAKPMIYR